MNQTKKIKSKNRLAIQIASRVYRSSEYVMSVDNYRKSTVNMTWGTCLSYGWYAVKTLLTFDISFKEIEQLLFDTDGDVHAMYNKINNLIDLKDLSVIPLNANMIAVRNHIKKTGKQPVYRNKP